MSSSPLIAGAVVVLFGCCLGAQSPLRTAREVSWSPDGSRIAFAAQGAASQDIFIADADGRAVAQVTNDAYADYYPRISPDGKSLAYVSARDTTMRLIVAAVDGTGARELVVLSTGARLNPTPPAWTPDGRRLAFAASRGGGSSIYTIDVNGSNERLLLPGTLPEWSPDGRSLAFSRRDSTGMHVYVADADGSNVRRVSTLGGQNIDASWSPDGAFLVYLSVRRDPGGAMDGRWPRMFNDLRRVNRDGRDDVALLTTPEREFEPRISPDGRAIVFLRELIDTAGKRSMVTYVSSITGTNVRPMFP